MLLATPMQQVATIQAMLEPARESLKATRLGTTEACSIASLEILNPPY
tara:strand:- start:10 stop:153 length:144 start_codon:yes stop_codon:yes gene_type:complete